MVKFDRDALSTIRIPEESLRVSTIAVRSFAPNRGSFPEKASINADKDVTEHYLEQMNDLLILFFRRVVHLDRVRWKLSFPPGRQRTRWNCSRSSCFLFNSCLFTSFSTFSCFCRSLLSRIDLSVDSSSWTFFRLCSFSRRFTSYSSSFICKVLRARSQSSRN